MENLFVKLAKEGGSSFEGDRDRGVDGQKVEMDGFDFLVEKLNEIDNDPSELKRYEEKMAARLDRFGLRQENGESWDQLRTRYEEAVERYFGNFRKS